MWNITFFSQPGTKDLGELILVRTLSLCGILLVFCRVWSKWGVPQGVILATRNYRGENEFSSTLLVSA